MQELAPMTGGSDEDTVNLASVPVYVDQGSPGTSCPSNQRRGKGKEMRNVRRAQTLQYLKGRPASLINQRDGEVLL